MNKKAFVFIDGGNFYFKLKKLTAQLDIGTRISLLKFDDVRLLRPEDIEKFFPKN